MPAGSDPFKVTLFANLFWGVVCYGSPPSPYFPVALLYSLHVSRSFVFTVAVTTLFFKKSYFFASFYSCCVHYILVVASLMIADVIPPTLSRTSLVQDPWIHWKSIVSPEMLGSFLGNMESLPLDDAVKMFSDFSLPMEDMVGQIAGIQEQIISSVSFSLALRVAGFTFCLFVRALSPTPLSVLCGGGGGVLCVCVCVRACVHVSYSVRKCMCECESVRDY